MLLNRKFFAEKSRPLWNGLSVYGSRLDVTSRNGFHLKYETILGAQVGKFLQGTEVASAMSY